ncbi:MAG: cell division protein FtsB [Chromatiales bacterium]|nr:cell division protein FtsB [Chromatiales bacterium]
MKSVIAILLTTLVVLQFQLWRGDRGMPGVWRLEAAVALQREDNVRLEARNRRLAAEVHDLKEGLEAVEERARTDLGMIGRDETFYQLIER